MVTDQHIRDLAEKQGWTDSTLADIVLQWVCDDPGRYAQFYVHLQRIATEEQRLATDEDPFAEENEEPEAEPEAEEPQEQESLLTDDELAELDELDELDEAEDAA